MDKKAIRQLYKQKRIELQSAAVEKMQDLMLINFQSLHLTIPDTVMTYSPITKLNEYDPVLIEEYCFFRNPATVLIYPVMDETNAELKLFSVKEDTFFELNEYDIEEPIDGKPAVPEAVGLMLVPLLAFDERGFRVGYGKGYYDKLITQCRENAIKVGFSFFPPVEIDDISNYDCALDFCITPDRVYQF